MMIEKLMETGLTREQAEMALALFEGEIARGYVSAELADELGARIAGLEAELDGARERAGELEGRDGQAELAEQRAAALTGELELMREEHVAELAALRVSNAVDMELLRAGAKSAVAAKALLADFLSSAFVLEDGGVDGLEDAVRELKEEHGYLFEQPGGGFFGLVPAEATHEAEQGGFEQMLRRARRSGDTSMVIRIKQDAAKQGVYLT